MRDNPKTYITTIKKPSILPRCFIVVDLISKFTHLILCQYLHDTKDIYQGIFFVKHNARVFCSLGLCFKSLWSFRSGGCQTRLPFGLLQLMREVDPSLSMPTFRGLWWLLAEGISGLPWLPVVFKKKEGDTRDNFHTEYTETVKGVILELMYICIYLREGLPHKQQKCKYLT